MKDRKYLSYLVGEKFNEKGETNTRENGIWFELRITYLDGLTNIVSTVVLV